MRKSDLVLSFFVLMGTMFAQFTTVSGTVTDPNGLPYANGTIVPTLVISGSPTFTATGFPYSPPSQPIGLSSSGAFIMQLADVTTLTPGGGTWTFNVCSGIGSIQPAGGKGPVCFLMGPLTISGASQDITTNISAATLALSSTFGASATNPTPPPTNSTLTFGLDLTRPSLGSSGLNALTLDGGIFVNVNNFEHGLKLIGYGSTGGRGPAVEFFRSRPTQSVPTGITTGDNIGTLLFYGYDGTTQMLDHIEGQLEWVAAEPWTVSSHATDAQFYITRSGNVADQLALQIQGVIPGVHGAGLAIADHLNQFASSSPFDFGGTCTMSASTSCSITLKNQYLTAGACVANANSSAAASIAAAGPVGCTVSAFTITITASNANSLTWTAISFGIPN